MTKYLEELISELQKIRDEEGNCPVAIDTGDGEPIDIDHVEFDGGAFIVGEES